MLLEKEIAEQTAGLSGTKKALLEKRLRAAMEQPPQAQNIPRRSRGEKAPLSYEQERLWFLDQLEPNSPLYSLPLALRLRGSLNCEALQNSLTAIVGAHDVLRTRVIAESGVPVQVTDPPAQLQMPMLDLSQRPPAEREIELLIRLFSEARRPFDLSRELMLRAALYRLADDEHVLLLNTHHIASDSWSWAVFFREMTKLYAAFSAGEIASATELPIQYGDFAAWQRERLKGDALASQLTYWRQQLAGVPALLELPADKPRPLVQSFRGATQTRLMPRDLADRFKALGRGEGTTSFVAFLAAFNALLVRYTQQEDLVVGSPVAGRNYVETQSLIGFFVNTLAIRTDASGDPSFRELLQRVRKVKLEACAHQELPFDKLVEELRPARSSSFAPLVQVMFVYQSPLAVELRLPGLTTSLIEIENGTAKFDLTMFLEACEQGLRATVEYNTDLFESTSIARLLQQFEVLLEGAAENPDRRISELPLISSAERDQLLLQRSGRNTAYPADKTLVQLFNEEADKCPDAIAVVFGERQLTYRELDCRANQLARYLQSLGVGPDTLVAVGIERSLEMIVAVLGILKAGGAYVSLEASCPQERLAALLEQTQAPVLITSAALRANFEFAASRTRVLCLDAETATVDSQSSERPDCDAGTENLAYVSFTSGSTGRPKGVCIPHRGVVRLIKGCDYAELRREETLLQFSPLAFDASTFEIWGALANGARLVIFPAQTPSLNELGVFIREQRITTLWLTAGLFHQMVEEQIENLRGVRQLLAGGDVLSVSHVTRALQMLPNCRLINGYGPTENTTFTCCHRLAAPLPNHRSVPIGRPIANTEVFVLDQHLQLAPVGIPGELYVGGDGLARGYLNEPQLTAEKFVAHPFSAQPGARLYRTGDLVRWLPDGTLEFMGRNDGQVKIRGFRVETGEVEAVLERHPEVKQCAVIARQDSPGEKRLIAYVVTQRAIPPSAGVLRSFLQRLLPDYMLPAAFVFLQELPLSPSGKVDRGELPPPDRCRPDVDRKFVAPRDDAERQMAKIWEELLGTGPIGANDNFFELGGHSLLAIRLLSRVEKIFGKALPVATVFQAPTLEEVARIVHAQQSSAIPAMSSAVEIQPRGSKPPLFLVHGAGGGMFWGYANLSRCLGEDQPVYAFKSRGLDGLDEYNSIEEMAAHYVADMRARQPTGPYYIGGYCFGGNVAYEMARQLEAQGERTALLALMNSAPPNSKYVRVVPTPAWIARFVGNLCYFLICYFHRMPRQRRDFIIWQLRGLGKRLARRFAPARDAASVRPDEVVDLSGYPPDQRRIWEAHIHSLFGHHTRFYSGRVTLLRSRGHQFWCSFEESYGWSEFAAGGVAVHIVPGAHEQILEEPHVHILAEALGQDLKVAQTRNAREKLSAKRDEPLSVCTVPAAPVAAVSAEGISAVSLAQERLWFIEQLEPGNAVHNTAVAVPFRGGLNLKALKLALEQLRCRHEILRVTFVDIEGKPSSVLQPADSFPLGNIDLTGRKWDPDGLRVAVVESQRPFRVAGESLFRGSVLSFSDFESVLVLCGHQMLLDRCSMEILVEDLLALYESIVTGKRGIRTELPLQYSHFAAWQRKWLNDPAMISQLEYWKNHLAGAVPLLAWPADRSRPAVESHGGARQAIVLNAALVEPLRTLGHEEGASLFVTLLAAFQTLAHRYTGRDDIIVGCPTSYRKRIEFERLAGNLANTLVLRTELSGDPSFRALIRRVRSTVQEAEARRDLPFEKLLDEIHPARDRSYHPLFQLMFDFKPLHTAQPPMIELDLGAARCDLALELKETASGVEGWIEYASDLFNPDTIRRLADNWQVLLEGVAANPDRTLSSLPLLTESERKQLCIGWNDTALPYIRQTSIPELFEAQVARTPDAPALVAGETILTYRELNGRANQLAHHLRSLGVQSESLVGICLDRSWPMVVGILGVLKAGGAYVPLDPAYPKDRLSFILEDARAQALITQSELLALFPGLSARGKVEPNRLGPTIVCLEPNSECFSNESRENLTPSPPSGNLAYVIYTSGSTGKPKGVAIEHRSVLALVHWAKGVFSADELAGVLASTSICFDLSVFELFVPLSLGGRVILAENALQLPALTQTQVTLVNTVPSAMTELLRISGVPSSVRIINLAGEPLSCLLVDRIYQDTAVEKVYDLYGPSETTVYSTFALRKPGEPATIGRPLANERVYLLDQSRQLVPIGVPGELYIGGDGLGREYLHRPELTAEKFVPDPFAPPQSGQRLYRTGDLARYRADGNIEFLGRIDFQVKIRGFRIELGEIEAALRRHPGVQDAIVIAREDQPGDKRLVAYVVLRVEQKASNDELRLFLRERLPDYMVPSLFVPLPEFPLTPNGKVDRKQLPAPDQTRSGARERFVGPRSPTEHTLAAIWGEVLSVKEVGVHDNFFDLGGHSLLAIQVLSRIRQAFKVELPLATLFDAPTIAALAEGLTDTRWANDDPATPEIERAARESNIPLSFSQERLWFIDQLEPGKSSYNVPCAVALEGQLDAARLRDSLDDLVQRHEVLRTIFSVVDGEPVQVIAPSLSVALRVTDVVAEPQAESEGRLQCLIQEEIQRPFDLAVGPLMRCVLFRLHKTRHVLTVTLHHTVSDGWSLGVFFRDLAALYASRGAELAPTLKELPVQYADYAIWQRHWLHGEVLEKQLAYWKESLEGAPGCVDLPVDHPREANSSQPGAHDSITLSARLRDALPAFNRREGVTLYMTLLASLAVVLKKWTQQSDLVLGSVVAGRTRPEIEKLIGCFMNFLPLRVKLADDETVREALTHVKATVLASQPRQDCPFEKIVEVINPERRLDQNPIYNVGFLLQNFPRAVFTTSQLTGRMLPIATDNPLLDLMFLAEEDECDLSITCQYRSDLFEAETIKHLLESFRRATETLLEQPGTRIEDFALPRELQRQAEAARLPNEKDRIVIAATFTAEPLDEPLQFWMGELELPSEISFAPYNQVFQQLLDPGSPLARNSRGLNVVLVRMEDWETGGEWSPDVQYKIEQHVRELILALKTAAGRASAPYLVCVCPSSRTVAKSPASRAFFREMEVLLASELAGVSGMHLVASEEMSTLYPVADTYDPQGDELGHVPYTSAFFTALATMVARKWHLLRRVAPKVIVLDCDHTLWAGVCGEDGPAGIRLDSPWRELQQFMREQAESGRLLCLCSKNNEEDVHAVFAQRTEMPLRREDFAACRINWRPKSENLKALAAELNLGLDSFIFVDDNPVECAEVHANCPEVTALQLPEVPELIPQFLKHCWVFDRLQTTAEDRQRTALYQQNRLRDEVRAESLSLADFLKRLDLKVCISELSEEKLARVAQLTHRTNQFNFTTRRRTEAEIRQLRAEGYEILTTSVSDRFGDYGLVGVAIYRVRGEALEVDTFLMSCRVLGRGVEHQLLAHLGEVARQHGTAYVDIHFAPTQKNQPAFDFLNGVGASFGQASNGGYLFRFPAEYAAGIALNLAEPVSATASTAADSAAEAGASRIRRSATRQFIRWRWVALEASEANKIVQLIEAKASRRARGQRAYADPRNELERQLCQMWGKLLRIDRIGIHDNFFELGGHSLLAVRLFAEAEKLIHKKLPIVTIFQAPTVAQLAAAIRAKDSLSAHPSLVSIQAEGTNPPLFLVHGAGGDVLWGYANLARHLGINQPVFGIQARHGGTLCGQDNAPQFESLEHMASHYVSELRAFQPHGPYYLGGYCFGGNVAYEMARQLRALGEPVALVALLECAPSNGSYEKPDWHRLGYLFPFLRNLGHWVIDFFDFTPAERRNLLWRKIKALARKVRRRVRPAAAKVSVDLEDVIDPAQFPEKELKLWQVHLDLLVRHVSQPYAGKVTVFRTRAHPLVRSFAPDMGWSELTQEGVDVRIVPGSHARIFVEPNIRDLARELQTAITEAKQQFEGESDNRHAASDMRLAA